MKDAIGLRLAKRRRWGEEGIKTALLICALLSILTTAGIIAVLSRETWGFFMEVPIFEFLFGLQWTPLLEPRSYGVLPLLGGEPGWRRRLLQLGSGASLVLGVFAALNWYRFGAPWITSYSRVLVVNGGQLALADHLAAFNRPFWEGLWLQLFDSGHGLLATTPAAVLALGGFFLLPRRARRPGLGAGLFFLATFLFYCKYDFLTGSSFSNRFLMPALASCALPLGALLQRLVGHGKRRNDSGSGQRT